MYIGLHVKCRYCCQTLIKLQYSRQSLEQVLNIKFHENPSRECLVVTCGQTDMTQLIVAFRDVANAPQTNVFPRLNVYLTYRLLLRFREMSAGFLSQ